MKASEWIDRVKSVKGWESDYRASKELGLSRQAISDYRVGRSLMDEEAALKVADALGQSPEIILIDQAAERMKSPAAKSALAAVLQRLGGVAAGLVVAVGVVSVSSPAEARTASPTSTNSPASCILC